MFEVGDRVELESTGYEDSGHKRGDTGTVVDQQVTRNKHFTDQDIRVRWDNGTDECWIPAEDCSKIGH